MDIQQQIFGLMAAAKEQQETVEAATRELEARLRELKEERGKFEKAIQKAADKILGRAVESAIDRLDQASLDFKLKFVIWTLLSGAATGGMVFIILKLFY